MSRHLKTRLQWETHPAIAQSIHQLHLLNSDELIVVTGAPKTLVVVRVCDGSTVRVIQLPPKEENEAFRGAVCWRIVTVNAMGIFWERLSESYEKIIGVLDAACGAPLGDLPLPRQPLGYAIALDAPRDLLYTVDPYLGTVYVRCASDCAHHLRQIALPLRQFANLHATVVAQNGDLVLTATKWPNHISGHHIAAYHLHVLVYNCHGVLLRWLTKPDAVAVSATYSLVSALDANGADLLYVANAMPSSTATPGTESVCYSVTVMRLLDGRTMGTLATDVDDWTALCATPTSLLLCNYRHDTVTSLQLPARLPWQPDASVHALFDEDQEQNAAEVRRRGGDGCRGDCFLRVVPTVLAMSAVCGSSWQRLPLELVCLVFSQLAPVVVLLA